MIPLCAALVAGGAALQGPIAPPATQLVVLIAVDQMRADYLARFSSQWTGGFARLYRGGTVFEHGQQDHAATETAPGHSTMLSGRYPAHTGIALNNRGVQDRSSPVVGADNDTIGASPRRFRGTTLVDWMLARDSGVHVLSVSRKDRAAIFRSGALAHRSSGSTTVRSLPAGTTPTRCRPGYGGSTPGSTPLA